MEVRYIVPAADCKRIKDKLEEANVYDKRRRIEQTDDGRLAIPVTHQALKLRDPSFDSINFRHDDVRHLSPHRPSPKDKLKMAVESSLHLDPALEAEIPTSWEIRGDLILLSRDAFRSKKWEESVPDLWDRICACLGVSRVARQSVIKSDEFRSPTVDLVRGDSGWVKHKENGIVYCYDVTKCMFSSGNISEKQWIGRLDCQSEVIVDLYAGIGYFTLTYLIHANARHVHACEWNRNAVTALRESLEANNVSTRCTIYEGDNRKVAPHGIADRVNLGLIPSCEDSWETACKCLNRSTGGWLHIHGNVNSRLADICSSKQRWMAFVVKSIKKIFSDLYSCELQWTVSGSSPRKVKSYGPHIWHMVVDVECRPGHVNAETADSITETH
ncbi:tRNA wybutosine-synthesizing protein 2 homolog isoform X2 [Corticium candelabrum]|uniref:tRNA wybutosine-synthesizing protein 2 homolog isoform X2 n=1 Tax=Corticium candelabrum TaxID=121492 RepID=UPI002E259E5D|nr:tRNA wybutosine-synthesizing protein 2 homolog isoform X2 [Corticium candelabrum]